MFNSDRLLYILSAKQDLSWTAFKSVFAALYPSIASVSDLEKQSIKNKRLEVLRSLDALGHCDFDFTGNSVYVAPPALVRLPCAGFPQAVLAGARSPQTLEQIKDICNSLGKHINVEIQPDDDLSLVPRRITVQVEDAEELRKIADSLKIHFKENPAAWEILNFSGSLQDYLATRTWSDAPELNWQRQTFNTNFLQFHSHQDPEKNIRLSQYKNLKRNTQAYYFWRDGQSTEIDRDWGRYAVLSAMHINILFYDKRKFMMAVPIGAELPCLLKRALTLCSGYVPEYRDKIDSLAKLLPKVKGFNLFQSIPPQIAEMAASKLSQNLIIQSLDI
ncbi:hypothetical protein [Phormidium tenue]|uniref:hypothetical protein n=1 Tax=Phormidium tenue TaxID=126344 RepID=UPI001689C6DD|nr:hypothetical protein [Phormidium tenue]